MTPTQPRPRSQAHWCSIALPTLAASALMLGAGAASSGAQAEAPAGTYAERLGWPGGTRVLILHVDDAGMSHESNIGALRSMREGVANSVSVMMPCPWVSEFVELSKHDPTLDVGLHLTLNSEWALYRWGPVASKSEVPGLVDPHGALWRNVAAVARSATADEVETEIRAQIDLARAHGIEPTHVDSHMGALFAKPEFLERYVKVAIDEQIPAMLPAGHNTLLLRQQRRGVAPGSSAAKAIDERMALGRRLAERLWDAGLPVLDDLHNFSYEWIPPEDADDEELREFKVGLYVEALAQLQPGVTMMINHASDAGDHFLNISGSGPNRRADLLALLDPRVARAIEEGGIVLATWRELHERRRALRE